MFVQITGSLILAAGVQRAFDGNDLSVITLGYVVMRISPGGCGCAPRGPTPFGAGPHCGSPTGW
nr:low temperature requirement protein A [Streptomyces sp. NBC_00830]